MLEEEVESSRREIAKLRGQLSDSQGAVSELEQRLEVERNRARIAEEKTAAAKRRVDTECERADESEELLLQAYDACLCALAAADGSLSLSLLHSLSLFLSTCVSLTFPGRPSS